MRNTRTALTCCLAGAALLLLAGSGASSQALQLPPVTQATWGNGVSVVLMEYRRAPTLTVRAIFPGGSTADPAGKAGTASLTATLLTRGTGSRTAEQVAEEIEFLGGS